MEERAPAIGIDFGTANCSMAWYDPRTETAEVILNSEGQVKTPSLVFFGENEILVGGPVEDLLRDVSTERARREDVFRRTVASIKRNMLSPPRIALPGGLYVRPVDVAAEVLKKLKRDAEDGLFHEEVARAVITCPAEFNVLQRAKIEQAGLMAGFAEVVLVEEPVTGALAYARAGLDVGEQVLVYDLGGGTFDLAVLDNEEESFHVAMEPKGMERCGGDDFDLALYHHCDEIARETLGRPISLSGTVDLSFLRVCRRGKESLTFQRNGRISDYLSSENGPVRFEHEVDRATFEDLIGEYIETTTRLTKEILEQAEAKGHAVDTVVLVGGSTRVPLVERTLKETLPVNPLGFDRKDVAVALGAAHYANLRWAPARTLPAREDRAATERYRAAVEETAADRRLDRVEVQRLNAFARQLELDDARAAEVERRVLGTTKEEALVLRYRKAVETFWRDRRLNPLEAERLEALARELEMDREEVARAEREIMGGVRAEILAAGEPEPRPRGPSGFVLARTLDGHAGEVHSVAFSSDGRYLASGAADLSVRGWDARTGRSAGTLAGNQDRVLSVAFDPVGTLLASGGLDHTVRVWKLPNGEPFHTLNHGDWVFSVAFSRDSARIASGGADAEIRLWDLATGRPLRSFTGHEHWVQSLVFLPGGGLVSGSADATVRTWDVEGGAPGRILRHSSWVRSVAVDPSGQTVASGGEDGRIGVWNLPSGDLIYRQAAHSGPVLSVAIGPDGRRLITGGADGRVKLWDLPTGEPLHVLPANPRGVGCVAAAPTGGLFASGGADRVIWLWRETSESHGETAPRSKDPTAFKPQDLPD